MDYRMKKDKAVKQYVFFIGLFILCMVAICIAGCTGQGRMKPDSEGTVPAPAGSAVQVGHFTFSEAQNDATVSVKQGNTITLSLNENPTTGYQWNLTTTPGLKVTRDIYVPSDVSGKIVGSGGTHVWEIVVDERGRQMIQAVYKRSWEPVTGNETTFRMTVLVE